MRAVGVIAEYNPFHNGHAYHLRALREKTACDSVTVIMSGNFVQRGEPAVADKYTRAAWALRNGADLVLELPSYYALANAQLFAQGAVNTLAAAGFIDSLGFGAGAYDIDTIYASIAYKDANSSEFYPALKRHLNEGKSYPRAAYDALSDLGAPEDVKAAFFEPNSILAIEYVRAISASGADITPVLIRRRGCGHDSSGVYKDDDGVCYASASYIRGSIVSGTDVSDLMPGGIAREINAVDADKLSALVLYALRSMSLDDMRALPDVKEGLYSTLYDASRRFSSVSEILERLKSKRYTLARLKRLLMCALLRIDASYLSMEPGYIRVLGVRSERKDLLKELVTCAKLPVILSARDVNSLDARAQDMFERDCFASDVYSQLTGKKQHTDLERPLLTV